MKGSKSYLKIRKTLFILFYSIIIGSCGYGDHERKLSSAYEQAGANKQELLKVIEHYSKDPVDSMKLRAAHFLIENMPGHFSYDTSYLKEYRPVVEKLGSLRAKGLSNSAIMKQVNPLMDSMVSNYPLSHIYSKIENDLISIKSNLLIGNIDQAFESYNSNPFKDSILYDDFLEYVLPYRVQNGYCLEEWRPFFTRNYSFKAGRKFLNVHQYCDSILYNFNNVKIGWKIANQYPYIKLDDYLKSLLTHCPQKCWFNCLLLRSFGIPVTIDFVPASRVHELGHEWNSLKLKDGLYPFDPFWVDSIRYLKSIYERKQMHPNIGPIQFPKIYRKTFKMNATELLRHAIHSGEEIPPFFRDPFMKDVTDEYFKTFSIEAPIVKNTEEVEYAYSCVMGFNQTWIPVDFGKIKKGKVSFSSLGSANVYLPTFYKSGNMIPAAYPTLINENGNPSILCPDTLNTRKIKISYVAFPRPELEEYKKSFIGCTLEGANNKNFAPHEDFYQITKSYEPGTYRIPITTTSKYRFIRFTIPNLTTALNEIRFFSTKNGIEKEVKGNLISSYPNDSIFFQKIVDGNLLTGVNFNFIREEYKLPDKVWIGYDFKCPISISAFEFYFVFNANIRKGGIYELLYWDFGWKPIGQKESSSNTISFDHVPENTLLMIRIKDTEKYSRIFTYSEGKQHWW